MTALSEIRQKRTQNTFLYSVKASVYNGFQREATFYYPLWWYDLPQVMYSFFDEYDFSGKKIIPFDVHRGSRLSGTPDTIQELEPEAAVISDGFAVAHETAAGSVSDVAADVEEWLHGLGY